jgi:LysM repeat protein
VIGNLLKPVIAVVALLAAAVVAAIAANSQPATPASSPAISMTLFVTPTVIQPPTETPDLAPVAAIEALAPMPTSRATQVQVIAGDTLWDIAVRFDLSLDEIIAANPNVNPDWLRPGDLIAVPIPGTVQLPTSEPIVLPSPAPMVIVDTSPTVVWVAADATGLRLREAPNTGALVKLKLNGLTPLTMSGRTEDNAWLRVTLADGTAGWVMARYVDLNPTNNSAPVAAQPATAFQPQPSPYVNVGGLTDRIRAIYQAGLATGNQPNVFAVVGDSNSVNTAFLSPIDAGVYDLGEYQYLQDTVDAYRGSFRHNSVAAVVGINTTRLYNASFNDSPNCSPGETRLACEYRLKRPSVALILIGTNDVSNWQNFEANYRPIIEYTLGQNIVPILVNKGDDLESSKYGAPFGAINAVVAKLSQEYGLPLADVHAAIQALPNKGFLSDGFHYNAPPGGRSVSFAGEAMAYGHTMRNLVTLQALDAVRRVLNGG